MVKNTKQPIQPLLFKFNIFGNVSVTEERIKKWEKEVKSDIHKEIINDRTLKLVKPDAKISQRKDIMDLIWKQHKRGKRSYLYQHFLKIKAINEN